ncbi:hypothetical protein HBO32_18365 [Pseudomonas nitroreducens]|uniref:hypothetical protein n=1 Tax=Pseudomonas nitroreducens TaxID=46680 RepID=UPI00147301F1|nr:hypothetical protein [Pseudomonas nitroreducens]NMZ75071.1 hypothetical protein [Pseudomonas nitroreducens]
MSKNYESKLASKCQGVAACLSYNGPKHEAEAKQILNEASHVLDSHAVRIHQKADGLLMINARGKCRYMTWRERLARWLLGGAMEIRP